MVIGNSDGAVTLAADACLDAGLDLVPARASHRDGRVLTNPIDLSHRADASTFAPALDRCDADPESTACVVVYTPPRLEWDHEVVDVVLDASAAAPEVTFAATMLGAAGRAGSRRDGSERDRAARVPIFRFPEDAAHAIGRLSGYPGWRHSMAMRSAGRARVGRPRRRPRSLEPLEHRPVARGTAAL